MPMLKLFVLFLFFSVIECRNKFKDSQRLEGIFLNNIDQQKRTLTAFWFSNDKKISEYFDNFPGRFHFNEEQAKPLELPSSYLSELSDLSTGIAKRQRTKLRFFQTRNRNRARVAAYRQQRTNLTCTRLENYNCNYTDYRSYVTYCSLGGSYVRCIRERQQVIQRNCHRYVKYCCDGYEVGPSGYCEKIPDREVSGCGGFRLMREKHGIIMSPGHPNNYPGNLNCHWTIAARSNELVIIKLMDLDTEKPVGLCDLRRGNCFEHCPFDRLQIRNNRNSKINTLCGTLLPQNDLLFSGEDVDIFFVSDSSNESRGFKLAYSVINENRIYPQTCDNGQVWSFCRRICRLTCEDTISSKFGPWKICIKSDGNSSVVDTSSRDDVTCEPGCACPSDRPIWHNGSCVKIEHCRQKIFQCGIPLSLPSNKIIGGVTARDGNWPWMVQITNNYLHIVCAGTLICSDWVATAAHCFLNRNTWTMPRNIDRNKYWFHLGKYWQYMQQDGRRTESYRASRILVHPQYNFTNDLNDLVLIQLDGFARQWDRIRPICLPPPLPARVTTEERQEELKRFPGVNDECLAAGWGVTRNVGPTANRLKQVRLPITPARSCRYSSYEWRRLICAGGLVNADTCQGDSGGPFACGENNRWVLRGITSFGDDCALGIPGGYTRISHYIPWIRRHIGYQCGV